jgi:hypothetical protein
MKNRKNNKIEACEKFESLIIKMKIGDITEAEKNKIARHLSRCKSCAAFEKSLNAMENELRIDKNRRLRPDPQVRKNLIAYLRHSERKQKTILEWIWVGTREFFQIRIPIYQILSVAILLVFIVIGMEKFTTSYNRVALPDSIPQLQEGAFNQFNIINYFQLIDSQKIGRTFSEDSLLIKLFVRSF